MGVEEIIEQISALGPAERRAVRASIEWPEGLEGPAAQDAEYAESAEVQRVAGELTTRFPESMKKLARP